MTHFSYDMSKEDKKKYMMDHPRLKMQGRMPLVRTYLCVQKIRTEVNGQEQCNGFTCEAGYDTIISIATQAALVAGSVYGAAKIIKKFKK